MLTDNFNDLRAIVATGHDGRRSPVHRTPVETERVAELLKAFDTERQRRLWLEQTLDQLNETSSTWSDVDSLE